MMTTLSIEIGSRIKELRVKRGILQSDLAAMCNFEISTMSRIETGRTNPTVTTLARISEALKVPIRELFPE